jgi:hypothetical protein
MLKKHLLLSKEETNAKKHLLVSKEEANTKKHMSEANTKNNYYHQKMRIIQKKTFDYIKRGG